MCPEMTVPLLGHCLLAGRRGGLDLLQGAADTVAHGIVASLVDGDPAGFAFCLYDKCAVALWLVGLHACCREVQKEYPGRRWRGLVVFQLVIDSDDGAGSKPDFLRRKGILIDTRGGVGVGHDERQKQVGKLLHLHWQIECATTHDNDCEHQKDHHHDDHKVLAKRDCDAHDAFLSSVQDLTAGAVCAYYNIKLRMCTEPCDY